MHTNLTAIPMQLKDSVFLSSVLPIFVYNALIGEHMCRVRYTLSAVPTYHVEECTCVSEPKRPHFADTGHLKTGVLQDKDYALLLCS